MFGKVSIQNWRLCSRVKYTGLETHCLLFFFQLNTYFTNYRLLEDKHPFIYTFHDIIAKFIFV